MNFQPITLVGKTTQLKLVTPHAKDMVYFPVFGLERFNVTATLIGRLFGGYMPSTVLLTGRIGLRASTVSYMLCRLR